ncbi:PAS domain-containing protein, partial [Spirochaetota bacterium]
MKEKVQNKIPENSSKYRSILENIDEGYYEVDLKGNFIFINNAMQEIFGFSKNEMMKKNFK